MATPRPRASSAASAVAPETTSASTAPPVAREPARTAMPPIPGRVTAFNRAGQPVQRAAAEAGVNQFHVPSHLPPPDWDWAWKEETILGEVRQGVSATQAQVGWEPVMHETYPGVFAPEYDETGKPTKGPIRRNGLILKERPMPLTEEARREEKAKADNKLGAARHQYSKGLGSESSDYDDSARRASYIKQAPTHGMPGYDPGGAPKNRQSVD